MTPAVPPPDPQEQTAIKRATKKMKLPMVSGTGSVVVLFICFAVSAAIMGLVVMAVHLPPWIGFELVLAAWWVVWSAALAHFLFYGRRVSDDHQPHEPRKWWPLGQGTKSKDAPGGAWLADVPYVGGDAEGCAWVIGIILAIVAVFFLAWLLVEVVAPVLALILYGLIRGMLARVANDTHHCTGRFGTAFLWGTLWATVYTAPLALLVFVIHMIVVSNRPPLG